MVKAKFVTILVVGITTYCFLCMSKSGPDHSFKVLLETDSTWMAKDDITESFLRKINCPVHNCLITRNSTRLASIGDFDAVLLLAENEFLHIYKTLEHTRTRRQIYGLLLLEPPHIVQDLSQLNSKINWTLSYRVDADVRYDYGGVREKMNNHFVNNSLPMWRAFDPEAVLKLKKTQIPQIVANKTKMIAWMVSNCDRVKSRRMELADAIGEYIPVDIYGKCGTLKCERGGTKCMDMLERDYKFYLSFENSLCLDYITEKAYRVMERTIIPVIFNGADISRFLPPKSYINVEDFATVKELTDHLIFLANNPEEYLKYFWWKEFYAIGQAHYSCALCQKLNEWDRSKSIAAYEDLDSWYRKDTCRDPLIEF